MDKIENNKTFKLFDGNIAKQENTDYLSASDLIRSANRYLLLNGQPAINLQEWLNRGTTKEFIVELELHIGKKAKIANRGRHAITWFHPFLFIDLALAISPKLKIEVYGWLYDELLKYRNNSGESYKKMTGALWNNSQNKSKFPKGIITTANLIKTACNVTDWENANEKQLNLRDRIHENIALLCDVMKDNNQAIRIGIAKAIN